MDWMDIRKMVRMKEWEVRLSVHLSVKLLVREWVGYFSMPGVHTGKQTDGAV